MDTNVGATDGEQTLSEIHERERAAFQSQIDHQQAMSTAILAEAGKGFAKTEIYKAAAFLIRVATLLGSVAAGRELVKWW